jgi:hypothetical protein
VYSPIKCATKTSPLDPTNFCRDFSGNHGWKPSNSKQRNRVPTCSDRKPLRKTLINLHAKKSNHHHPVIQVYQKNKCWKWGNCLLIVGPTTVDWSNPGHENLYTRLMSIPDWNSLGFSGVPFMDIYGWFKLNHCRMLHWIFSRSLPMFTPFSECLAYPKFFPMRYVRLSPSSNVGKRSSLWRADRMTSDVKQMEKNLEPRWTNKKLKQREYIYICIHIHI